MTQSEVIQAEKNITARIGSMIHMNIKNFNESYVDFQPKNDKNQVMKLRTCAQVVNDKIVLDNILLVGIMSDLRRVYSSSGLDKKLNGKVIMSDILLTPTIFNPDLNAPLERGVMVSYRYDYDEPKKSKMNPLDRY